MLRRAVAVAGLGLVLAFAITLGVGARLTFGQAGTSSPSNGATVNAPFVINGSGFGDNLKYSVTGCEASYGITTVNTGSATTTTGANCVLAGAIVDAVVIRTTTTITTAASFEVGVSGSLARYCVSGNTNITAGNTVVCSANWASGGVPLNASGLTAIVVTFNTTPAAGAMRIIVYSHQGTAPTS